MVSVLYKLEYSRNEKLKDIKNIFSIHNLHFKGMFSKEVLPELFGYDYEAFYNGSLEHNGAVSFLKGGINYSDKITTVSNSYVEEIKTPEYGEGLEGLLKYREDYLCGIVNGIDYKEYDPYLDNKIDFNYNSESYEKKLLNKKELQKEFNLEINEDIPLIGIVSRLTHQKGCDLILNILEEVLKEDVQIVILGTGDYIYEEGFKNFSNRYPNKVSVNIRFSNDLAHKVYAASDMFLMPSLFEPCGLGQLIALRYGSIPIVRETGGLKDTITPYNEYDESGNGFGFKSYYHLELLNTIKYALKIYSDKKKWDKLVKSAMESDNSWEKSAKEYISLYKEVISK